MRQKATKTMVKVNLAPKLYYTSNINFNMGLKACVRYFHKIFIFSPNDNPSKTMKNAFYFI